MVDISLWTARAGDTAHSPKPGRVQGHHISLLGCHSQIPQTGRLKQQKFVFSQFWKLKVQDQGAVRVGF